MTDKEKWASVPLEIRLYEDLLAIAALVAMFAGILFWPALLIGAPLMIRGLVLESRHKGFTVDVDKYTKRGAQ